MFHANILINYKLFCFYNLLYLFLLKIVAKANGLQHIPYEIKVEEYQNISNKIQTKTPQECLKLDVCLEEIHYLKGHFQKYYKNWYKNFNKKIHKMSTLKKAQIKQYKRSLKQNTNEDLYDNSIQEKSKNHKKHEDLNTTIHKNISNVIQKRFTEPHQFINISNDATK